jgi:hypothetical protein
MKHRHFENETASREALQIGELIADLDCIVQILNSDIVAEEERAHVFMRSLPCSVRRSLGLALLVRMNPTWGAGGAFSREQGFGHC